MTHLKITVMLVAPPTLDEFERVALLRTLELLDSAPEPEFDSLTRLTSRLLGVPIALISLVDSDRQWFKSKVGLEVAETPRAVAFCAHAIHGYVPFVVPDARLDQRFADNPLVTGGPQIRAYAGVPLRSADGHALGTLCAIDLSPRVFSNDDLSLLFDLAEIAQREILQRETAIQTRKVAGTSLRAINEAESFYRATFDRAAIGIAIVSLEGKWVKFNAKLCEILQRDAEELLGLTFQDITHPDDLNTDLGLVQKLLDGEGESYSMEKRYLRRDQGVVWANLTVTLVRAHGVPQHFISVVEDISSRHEAETALRDLRLELEHRVAERTEQLTRANAVLSEAVRQRSESELALAQSESELRAVLEGANDAFVSLDSGGMIVEWNRQAEQTFGWQRGEVLGKSLEDLIILPPFKATYREGLKEFESRGRSLIFDRQLEMPALCKDGRVISCEVSITALPGSPKGHCYAAFRHDISERAVAESRLAESERRLNAIVNDQTDIVFRFDPLGRLIFGNDAFLQAFKLKPTDFSTWRWQSAVLPEDIPKLREQLDSLSPQRPLAISETRLAEVDGEVRWTELVNRAFFDEQGALLEVQTVGRDVTERKRLQDQLDEASERMKDLYENAPCGYYSLDRQGKFLRLNSTTLAWLGCTREEVLGILSPADFFTEEGRVQFQTHFPSFISTGTMGPLEFDLISREGTARRVSVSASAVLDEEGRFLMSRSVMYDVTELESIRAALQIANREQHLMLDNDLIGIARLKARKFVWSNRAFDRLFGYQSGELDGKSVRLLYPSDDAFFKIGEAAYGLLFQGQAYRTQHQLVRKSGECIWVDMSGILLSPDTEESMWLMLDITQMKDYQGQVEELAYRDSLTQLPNRLMLRDRIGQALVAHARSAQPFAVCYLDLDGFKGVNDQFGHEAGDVLLIEVAQRLVRCVRAEDTVCRLGGDEFVLVLKHLSTGDDTASLLDRLLQAVANPVDVGQGRLARVSASIGVALHPSDASNVDELLAAADAAMYQAKAMGKNGIFFANGATVDTRSDGKSQVKQ